MPYNSDPIDPDAALARSKQDFLEWDELNPIVFTEPYGSRQQRERACLKREADLKLVDATYKSYEMFKQKYPDAGEEQWLKAAIWGVMIDSDYMADAFFGEAYKAVKDEVRWYLRQSDTAREIMKRDPEEFMKLLDEEDFEGLGLV